MRNYETPELNTLKFTFKNNIQNNIGLLSDNRSGDETPEDEFDN